MKIFWHGTFLTTTRDVSKVRLHCFDFEKYGTTKYETKAGYRRFARRLQDERNMRDARNSREKKGVHEIV